MCLIPELALISISCKLLLLTRWSQGLLHAILEVFDSHCSESDILSKLEGTSTIDVTIPCTH
jgi:hypothetical protein